MAIAQIPFTPTSSAAGFWAEKKPEIVQVGDFFSAQNPVSVDQVAEQVGAMEFGRNYDSCVSLADQRLQQRLTHEFGRW